MILGQAESQSWWLFSLPQLLCTVTAQEKEPFLKKKRPCISTSARASMPAVHLFLKRCGVMGVSELVFYSDAKRVTGQAIQRTLF